MAKINLFLCLLLMGFSAFTQPATLSSRNGQVHTPKGHLHILAVVVRYTDADLMKGVVSWPDSSDPGQLPDFVQGEINALFNENESTIGQEGQPQNLSAFYKEMSGGKFVITGKVYPVQVPINHIALRGGNFFSRQSQMNEAAVRWIAENDPGFDWSAFDQRTNNPNFTQDNSSSGPDGILDYVIFIHRAGGGAGGIGSAGNMAIPGTRFKMQSGHTGVLGYPDAPHQMEYFNHEFSHNLFSSPHYLGANRTDGNRFYTQKGWGLMHAGHAPYFTCNSWEAWWLGWHPVPEVRQDTELVLHDFVTTGEALRIPIEGTDDLLFLENHAGISPFDRKFFFGNAESGEPVSGYGLMALVASAPATHPSKPQLNPFSPDNCNFLRVLHGQGNTDFRFTGDSMQTRFLKTPVFEAVEAAPVGGQDRFQFIRADLNQNGKIVIGRSHGNADGGGGEQFDIWTERLNGTDTYTLASTGTPDCALESGLVLGLNAATTVANYPVFYPKQDSLAPYIISGTSVEIVSRYSDGSMKIRIKLHDWNVRTAVRWAGNLQLPATTAVPISLKVLSGGQLLINQSQTAAQTVPDSVSGFFAKPSRLSVPGGSSVVVEANGILVLDERSTLLLEDGATLWLKKGSELVVRAGSRLNLQARANWRVESGAKVRFETGGSWRREPEAAVTLPGRSRKVMRAEE